MNEITIVCCYNNEKMYHDFLDNIHSQSVPCEVIGINNCDNKNFSSCAAAYNSVINQVKTKYVIYSHQDIVLQSPDSIKKFLSYLERINTHDILGVAGVKFDTDGVFTNIKHVWKHSGETGFAGGYRVEGGFMECDTVDECFFGGYTEHFKAFPFNEKLCNNWHLYAVEACLQTKSNCVLMGGAFLCDLELLHLSSGNLTLSFHLNFLRLCSFYSKKFPFMRTTCVGLGIRTDSISLAKYAYRNILRTFAVSCLKRVGLYSVLKKFHDSIKNKSSD